MLKNRHLRRLVKNAQMQGGRSPEEGGVLKQYAAVTKGEPNAADGRVSTAC
jgi:hypothetical protein